MRWRMDWLWLFMVLIGSPAWAGDAQTLKFSLPVDCEIGKTCFVQNYFDHDPGPDFRDYACGSLGYDGHAGVDIRVADLPTMARGIAVIAAAPGRVLGLRDGMDDIDVRQIDAATIANREAGNGVVIDHGGGWQSQFSHLRRGSIRVAKGDEVATGDVLGMIGMSGNAAFPHVEFAVRYQGKAVDPFAGLHGDTTACGATSDSLWDEPSLAALRYTPGGILAAGFATRKPQWSEARRGDYAAAPRRDAPALVFWTSLFGGQKGDQILIRLFAPDGVMMAENKSTLKKNKALYFSFAGRKLSGESWPPGAYHGEFKLNREIDGGLQELLSTERQTTLQ